MSEWPQSRAKAISIFHGLSNVNVKELCQDVIFVDPRVTETTGYCAVSF